jgi:hypothetical protein
MSNNNIRVSMFLFASFAAAASGCGEETFTRQCGPNTVLRDGACASTLEDIVCGEGTTLDPASNQCVADVKCATGTTYNAATGECTGDTSCGPGTTLDPATGLCRSDSSCGAGTTFNETTGECEPDLECAAGTTLVNGMCVADDRCGPGTTFDPTTGTCTTDLRCGEGLVAHNNVCLTPAEVIAAGSDFTESIPDLNDPAYAGTAEAITLAPIGDSIVFTGTISRAVDLDGDMLDDQDRDVWAFQGTVGQRLRIRVISNGLPQPTFLLTGPEGYARSSIVGDRLEANREVVLPYAGEYQLMIAPAQNRLTAAAIGATTFEYAGIIEDLAWPTPIDVTVPGASLPAVVTRANVLDSANNFFNLRAPGATAMLISAEATGLNTIPALMVFTSDGRFVAELAFDPARDLPAGSRCDAGRYLECDGGATFCEGEEGIYRLGTCRAATTTDPVAPLFDALEGLFAAGENELVLFVDYAYSNGADVELRFAVSSIDNTPVGTATAGASLESETLLVPAGAARAFEFNVPEAGLVVSTNTQGTLTGRVFSLIGPNGLIERTTASTEHHFYALAAGPHRWIYVNGGDVDANVSFNIVTHRPIDTGATVFNGTAPFSASFTGEDLGYTRRGGEAVWFVVETSTTAIVQASWRYKQGLPDLQSYRANDRGGLGTRRSSSEDNYPVLRTRHLEPGRTLLRLATPLGDRTPDPQTREWRVDLEVYRYPVLRDAEPNDTQADARPLGNIGADPLRVRGTIANDELDVYQIAIDPPLAAGEVLRVQVENVETNVATMLRFRDSAFVQTFAVNATPVASAMFFAYESAGPWYIELEGTATDGPVEYVLAFERMTVTSEVEPNNTAGGAQELGAISTFPFDVFGFASTAASDLDWYRFELAAPLSPNEALWIRADNLLQTNDVNIRLYDENGTTVLQDSIDAEDGIIVFAVPGTGPYYVQVAGEAAARRDHYRLSFDVQDEVFDRPGITSIGNAATLGTLGFEGSLVTWGAAVRLTNDYYRVDLAAPLGANEALSIRWENALERGNITVALVDELGTELISGNMYASDLTVAPQNSAGPFFIRVSPQQTAATSGSQVYRLEVSHLTGVTAELEPNDSDAAAQALDLPANIRAQSRGGTTTPDPDVYRIVLPRDLLPNEVIEVRATVLRSTDDLTLAMRDSASVELATATGLDPVLRFTPPVATAGTIYYLSIVSTLATTSELSPYQASVAIAP